MKIAFLSTNQEKLPDPVVPYGILCVMRNLPDYCQIELWDLCFVDDKEAYLKEKIEQFSPDVIGVGIRNLNDSLYAGTDQIIQYNSGVLDTLRENSQAQIVLGGSGFSVLPAKLVQHFKPDFAIAGEAEVSFRALVECLATGSEDYSQIPALWYKREGKWVSNPPALLDMDSLQRPPRDMVDSRYYEMTGTESIQTKRGCALKCDYCTYPLIEGGRYRMRSPADVAAEMKELTQNNPLIEHLFVVDSTFNIPKHYAKKVCQALIDEKFDTPWTCYANPLSFDLEIAKLMKAAGCRGMEIGSDSGSNRILKTLRKGFQKKDIVNIHEACIEAGLLDCHTFILGTPTETEEDVLETLDFVRELQPTSAIMMVWIDDESVMDPVLAKERAELREWIFSILRDYKHKQPRWSIPPLGFNYDIESFTMLRQRGLKGPLWQHL